MAITVVLTPTQAPVTLVSSAHTEQRSVWDLVEALTTFLGADPGANAHIQIKTALLEARTEFQSIAPWTYLVSQSRLFLLAMQTDGTIAYDHTGGAYERLLTLTDATWPDWAVSGFVQVDTRRFTVARKLSATQLQLDVVMNPGADIDADTGYTLGLDTYELPEDFVAGDSGLPENNWGGMDYFSPAEYASNARFTQCFARPLFYTFIGDPRNRGRLAIALFPCPDVAQTLDFVYRRKMKEFTTWDYSTGKVTVTGAPSRQIVITGGQFKSYMAGDLIRLSANAKDIPTGREGLTPYAVERTIASVVDASTVLVDEDIPDNYASVAFRVSSPIDVEEAMSNAYHATVRKRLDQLRRAKGMADTEAQWFKELTLAREFDQRDCSIRTAGMERPWRLSIRHMPLGPEVG